LCALPRFLFYGTPGPIRILQRRISLTLSPPGGFRLRLNLLIGPNPADSANNEKGDNHTGSSPLTCAVVRPAGFEPAAYGFEEQES